MFNELLNSIINYSKNNAFNINDEYYTYSELGRKVSGIQEKLEPILNTGKRIGIIANNHFDTYAAHIAVILLGGTFVPIDPGHPDERNNYVIAQSGINTILYVDSSSLSKDFFDLHQQKLIDISSVEIQNSPPNYKETDDSETAYILFTSGSTGIPKGVPIQRKSLSAFVEAVARYGYNFGPQDRFLQIFDLTFDLSIFSWLIPLLSGACVYTIPKTPNRYSTAIDILEKHKINVALTVPSFIQFLHPYFDEIQLPALRLWFFCGEALHRDITAEWQKCIPNASIENVYGPTEATIFCFRYPCSKDIINDKAFNNILSIGKPFPGLTTILIDENKKIVKPGETGELCLAGEQVTEGYLKNQEKNKSAFFETNIDGQMTKFYRTGDLCYFDKEGDFMFIGRIDTQVKIQGFRVELSEIENHARSMSQVNNAIVLTHTDERGNTTIHLFVEPIDVAVNEIFSYLKTKVPAYMMPQKIYPLVKFPLNVNGKIDKPELQKKIDK
jgi:amino acid adenylation domain-containing protein